LVEIEATFLKRIIIIIKIMAKTIVFTMVMVKPNNIGKNNSLHHCNGEA